MKYAWLCAVCCLCGCGASLERHMNETLAYYLGKVHMACRKDADCYAVYKSCRYPQWGYVAINRYELDDLNRIRQADWYTRCKTTPDTSHIPAVCRGNRCALANPEDAGTSKGD